MVDILKSGTPEKFRNAMRGHLENHFHKLLSLRANNLPSQPGYDWSCPWPLKSFRTSLPLEMDSSHIYSPSSEKIYAFLRYDDQEKILVILNFGNTFFEDIKLLIPEDLY